MASHPSTGPLSELTDEGLVARFHDGDTEALDALLNRYHRFARAKSRSYFIVGGDADDIEQEGMIGLYKAARDFSPERQVSFRAFAELCVTRQVITAIKTANRRKHQPLNRYVSLCASPTADEPAERSLEALLEGHHSPDPADAVVSADRMEHIREAMARMLSELEVVVLRLYVEGKSYQEIGEQLGRHVKSIDNALQRIKRKVDAHLQEQAAAEHVPSASPEPAGVTPPAVRPAPCPAGGMASRIAVLPPAPAAGHRAGHRQVRRSAPHHSLQLLELTGGAGRGVDVA
jgi:RNA polymerase sporulation-specific sigma factor